MQRIIAVAIFVTMMVALCANAHATHRSWNKSTVHQSKGFYIGVNGGLNVLGDSSLMNATPLDINYDLGYLVEGSLGYDFGMFRVDAEIAYKSTDSSELVTPFGSLEADGSTSALSYMINGYFDIPTGLAVKPYVGVGIGYATISLETGIPSLGPPLSGLVDDSDSVLAYQVSAGVGYEISRSTTLILGYRYFATDDPEMTTSVGNPFTTEYQTHEFVVGVRFLFN